MQDTVLALISGMAVWCAGPAGTTPELNPGEGCGPDPPHPQGSAFHFI